MNILCQDDGHFNFYDIETGAFTEPRSLSLGQLEAKYGGVSWADLELAYGCGCAIYDKSRCGERFKLSDAPGCGFNCHTLNGLLSFNHAGENGRVLSIDECVNKFLS